MTRHAVVVQPAAIHVPWPPLRRPVRLVLLAAAAHPDNRAVVDRAIAIAIREHAELVAVQILPADHGLPLDAGDGPVPPELDRIVELDRCLE